MKRKKRKKKKNKAGYTAHKYNCLKFLYDNCPKELK